MIQVKIGTTGGAEALQRFQRAPPEVRLRLQTAMEFIGSELLALMKSKEAAELKRQTGKLERAFYTRTVTRDGDRFILTTGVARRAFYAAFQDRGIPGRTVDVKGYTRGVKGRNVSQGRRRLASGVGFVSAYRRQLQLKPQPFIGVSLEEMRDVIMSEIRAAIAGGLG